VSLLAEMRRRNVFKVSVAYLVGAWLLIQFADILLDNMQAPAWVLQAIMVLLAIGFFISAVVAWAYELTPEGIKREAEVDRSQSIAPVTGKKLNNAILVLMALGIAYLLFDKFTGPGAALPASDPTEQVSQAADGATGTTPGRTENRQSIAVLPFTNRSPDPNDAYFTDGVHDDLLTQLAKVDAFSVISRTSVLEYRDTAKNLKQIASELGVGNVMEGAVQRAGNRVRINVQLIDAGTDEHLWAEVYDRELTTEKLFDIQSEIARAIAGALQATLSDSELAAVSDSPTNSVEAYELYLQAGQYGTEATRDELNTAIAMLQAALAIDPQFALAWTETADRHVSLFWEDGESTNLQKARNAMDQARSLAPDLPELLKSEAGYRYWGFLDYDKALDYIDRAIARMPGDAEAHMIKGWASRRAGYWEQALASMTRSLELNPRQSFRWFELGSTHLHLHRYTEARAAFEQGRKVDPGDYWVKGGLALLALVESGDTDTALRLLAGGQHSGLPFAAAALRRAHLFARDFQAALADSQAWPDPFEIGRGGISLRETQVAEVLYLDGQIDAAREATGHAMTRLHELEVELGEDFRLLAERATVYAILGETERVRSSATDALALAPPDAVSEFNREYTMAQAFAMAGMAEEAVELIQPLLSGPSNISATFVRMDPAFDTIRNDPGFMALLEQYP
jgi:TolB-like protein/Tfp pilus assembly protein PilF